MSTPDPMIEAGAETILNHLHPAGGTWRLNPEAAMRSLREAGWRSPQEVQALQDRIDTLTESLAIRQYAEEHYSHDD